MPPLAPNTSLVRNPDLIATDMDGDTVMMSIERGEYFGIGGVGPRIWELLAQPILVAEIARVIGSEYAVDEAACLADMQAFAEKLIKHDLVAVA